MYVSVCIYILVCDNHRRTFFCTSHILGIVHAQLVSRLDGAVDHLVELSLLRRRQVSHGVLFDAVHEVLPKPPRRKKKVKKNRSRKLNNLRT